METKLVKPVADKIVNFLSTNSNVQFTAEVLSDDINSNCSKSFLKTFNSLLSAELRLVLKKYDFILPDSDSTEVYYIYKSHLDDIHRRRGLSFNKVQFSEEFIEAIVNFIVYGNLRGEASDHLEAFKNSLDYIWGKSYRIAIMPELKKVN
ncbi:MAG: hypothetical protein N4A44_03170 [Alphaproteobacteria bacterium]|jgi:hypothetical protein|nr:hypothetical protein [Alphaproteobacteria bacterium]